jgi:ribosome biogenesis GTPase / thiamine phosphate phosphatase
MTGPAAQAQTGEPGVIVSAHGRRYRVETAGGERIDCVTRGRKSDVACGDRVRVAQSGSGLGVIEHVEPRSSLFYRSDAHRQKLIAANVTQVAIVVAPVPPYRSDLLNRCLAAAEHARIGALILWNKTDLAEAREAAKSLDPYRRLGYGIVPLCARRDVSPLRPHLTSHTTLLAGESGMGKSTLVNALVYHAAARVAELSAALRSGRHTTTHAELYRLDERSAIIDSPGVQVFGLHHLSLEELAHAYVEFRHWLGSCRFRDCRHLTEPGCAIEAASRDGSILPARLDSYRRLARERLRAG